MSLYLLNQIQLSTIPKQHFFQWTKGENWSTLVQWKFLSLSCLWMTSFMLILEYEWNYLLPQLWKSYLDSWSIITHPSGKTILFLKNPSSWCVLKFNKLGLEFNTREIIVILPQAKKDILRNILRHWYQHINIFVFTEASSLQGTLNYTIGVVPRDRILLYTIRSLLLTIARKNRQLVMKREYFKQFVIYSDGKEGTNIFTLRNKSSLSMLAKAIYNSNKKCYINKSLREELNLLIKIIIWKPIH